MADVDPLAQTLAGVADDAGRATETLADVRRVPVTSGAIGKNFAHFRIEREIGRGGMGEVYLATDLALDRRVALKLLPRDIGRDADFRSRFVREARAQARLGHPNICHIYFIGEQDEQLFFAMEYVDGENLQQRLDRLGKLAPGDAVEIVRQAAEGLRAAAAQGFTHRDIKPSNLLLDRNGVVKLVDFGLVKEGRGDIVASGAGGIVGTPLYMAPEQARGEPVDLRTDIYALGVTLHHLVAGRPPFTAATPMAVVSKHLTESRPRLTDVRTMALLDGVCDRMMAKRPAARYSSYDELLRALEQVSPERTRAAGLIARGFALGIDGLVAQLLGVGIDIIGQPLWGKVNSWPLVAAVYVIFAHARFGQTLGKKALELELVGRRVPVGFRASAVRFAIAWAPAYLLIGLAMLIGDGYIPLAGESTRRGLSIAMILVGLLIPFGVALRGLRVEGKRPIWDRVAGTRVVYERRGRGRPGSGQFDTPNAVAMTPVSGSTPLV